TTGDLAAAFEIDAHTWRANHFADNAYHSPRNADCPRAQFRARTHSTRIPDFVVFRTGYHGCLSCCRVVDPAEAASYSRYPIRRSDVAMGEFPIRKGPARMVKSPRSRRDLFARG